MVSGLWNLAARLKCHRSQSKLMSPDFWEDNTLSWDILMSFYLFHPLEGQHTLGLSVIELVRQICRSKTQLAGRIMLIEKSLCSCLYLRMYKSTLIYFPGHTIWVAHFKGQLNVIKSQRECFQTEQHCRPGEKFVKIGIKRTLETKPLKVYWTNWTALQTWKKVCEHWLQRKSLWKMCANKLWMIFVKIGCRDKTLNYDLCKQ